MFRFNGFHNKVCFAPENEGGSAAPSFENVETTPTSNVLEVLHFDPFKKGDEIPPADKPAGDTGKEGTSGEGNGNGSPPAKPAPETKTPAPATTPAPAATDSHWQAIAENYKRQLEERTTTTAKTTPETPTKPQPPKYDFNIPDALIDVLTTETDKGKFKEGVAALASGIANAIQAQMLPYIESQFNPRFDTIPQMLQAHIAGMEKAKTVRQDFYGKYPELDKPQLHGFIRQIGDATAKEMGLTDWTPELRDETAKRVKEIMALASGTAVPAKPVATPPRMIGGNSARTAPANDDAGDIADTIFGNF